MSDSTRLPEPCAPPPRTPVYLWFDAEFTSLDTDQADLLQVALLVTGPDLRRLTPPDQDINLCVRLDPQATVSPWVEKNLSDLVRRCRTDSALPVEQVDRCLAALVDAVVGPPSEDIQQRPILAGNTIYMDLAIVRKLLPEFTRRLHYRLLDVSTLKVLWHDWSAAPAADKQDTEWVRRHLPVGLTLPPATAHDAYYDLHASLAELHYYRQHLVGPVT